MLIMSVVIPVLSRAQFPVPTNRGGEDAEPAQTRELVSRYCRLDYEGARLDPQAWPKFQPLVWWKSNPAYTQIDVVARYTVDLPPASDHSKYSVPVHYRLLGVYDVTTGYLREPDGSNQNVDFAVTTENMESRIADAENTSPHPSRAAMLKWLNEQIGATQDSATKTRLQNALQQLQAQSGSPFAK
jgi:hypothetical protein